MRFPYTASGEKAAKAAAKKTGGRLTKRSAGKKKKPVSPINLGQMV